MNAEPNGRLLGRTVELFHHDTDPAWGYETSQTDTFAVIHPENEQAGQAYPLYVVFHSAGHDVYSAIGCTWAKGNHDIYHTPTHTFALYVDCRAHEDQDWWWGGINAHGEGDPGRAGTDLQPVEKRVLDTVRWVLDRYPIDADRVYAVGNSMGGSGALGVCLNHGDLFAAIKVNVPAGVRHAADRCCLDTPAPAGFSLPDPPVVIDYSAQNDEWSDGHEVLYRGMAEKKYALIGFWGPFGHANDNAVMEAKNDLIHALPLESIVRNQPYPVFTAASTDDPLPWPDRRDSQAAGQVNGFFRWENRLDLPGAFEMRLFLLTPDRWQTRVTLPAASTADVTLRRLRYFRPAPGETVSYRFGDRQGTVQVGPDGLMTLPRLTVPAKGETLILQKA